MTIEKRSCLNTIPKIIHYCWFGKNPLPESAIQCINSWKKYMPNYEIKEWNEDNFDINCCQYVKEAYQEKKWAFVSDYARFWILYHHGGIYMDTDVELIKPLDDIIEKGPFMGCEPVLQDVNIDELKDYKVLVNPGLGLAVNKNHPFYNEVIQIYNKRSFYTKSGELDLSTVVQTTTKLLKKYGYQGLNNIEIINSIYIYPSEYFCPMNYYTGAINITSNTRSIHHYTASWQDDFEKKNIIILKKFSSVFGESAGRVLWRGYTFPSRIFNKISTLGICGTISFIKRKVKG